MKLFACIFACLMLLPFACPGEGQRDNSSSGLHLKVRSLKITRVSETGVEAEARIAVTPDANAAVEQIRFRNMRVAGIYFVVAPLPQVTLRRGEEYELPVLHMSASLAGLDYFGTLLTWRRASNVDLQGEATMTVRLNLLQRLRLRESTVQVIAVLREQASLNLSGLGGVGEDLSLTKSDSILALTKNVLRHALSGDTDADASYLPGDLLHVSSCATPSRCTDLLGFRMRNADGVVVMTTAEAEDPWAYSATMRHSFPEPLQPTHPIEVSAETITAVRHSMALSSMHSVTVHRTGKPLMFDAIVLPTHQIQTLALRGTPGCLGKVDGFEDGDAFELASAEDRSRSTWDDLEVVRLVHSTAGRWSWKLLHVTGTRSNGMIVLDSTVDSTSIGSPVLFHGKVVGLVQDENLATTL